jgi:hypothetical protein
MAEVSRFPDNASSFRSASTYKADARIEEQQWHWRTLPFPEGKDSWFYEDRLFSNSAIQDESSFVFSLAAIAPTTAGTSYHIGGSLVSWLGDTVETSQNVVIYLNGVQVANLTWDTSSNPDYTIDVTFSTALLRVGDNTLKLVQPKPAGTKVRSLCVDYLDVEYPAFLESAADTIDFSGKWTTGAMFYVKGFSSPYVNILRITDPAAPEILTAYMPITTGPGAPVTIAFAQQESSSEQRFLVLERNVSLTPHDLYLDTPSALADPNNSADYVIITHSAFFNAIQTLAAYRQSPAGGNHTVAVVRLEDVYDEFSYGNVDSQAIRDFIAYAFSYWGTGPAPGPQPLYVLLVGDTSEDYKNYWNFQKPGYDPPSYLPAREHYQNNPMWTRAPSDNWFACVAGDDIMPDLLIGRLPARDPAALAAVLAKIATYEAIPPGDPVNRRVAMLTDDNIFNTLTGCPPYVPVGELGEVSAGVFENGIVATYFPTANPANLLKLYAELYANSDEVRAAMAAAINGGVSFFTYYGHGAVTQLGQHCGDVAGSGKTFFNILDTPLLQNNAYPTVGLSCSCNVGDFEMIRDYTAGPLAGVFATQSLAEKLVMENGRGMVAFVTSTSETGIAEASADVQGAFDALYNPATIYLPPFNPDPRILGSVVYGVRMRLLEVFGMGDPPPYPVGTARDPIATLAILGDPALQMNMEAP